MRTKGFTLIELLVVLFIIGMLASTLMLNFVGDDKDEKLQRQVARIQALISLASDHALLHQQVLGLHVDDQAPAIRLMALDVDGHWQWLSEPEHLSEIALDDIDGLALNLEDLPFISAQQSELVDGKLFDETLSVNSDSVDIGEEEEQPPTPHIVIDSLGEFTPFELIFYAESADQQWVVRLEGQGYLPLQRKLGEADDVE